MPTYKDAVKTSSVSENNNAAKNLSVLDHLTGRVKWFNNKAGYGFITVTDGERSGSDIFVHHSSIDVENQQYKYLVQGEYVDFDLVHTDSKVHEWQASNVVGIKGGKLMCETRRDLKLARNEYKTVKTNNSSQTSEPKMPRQKVPREVETNESERKKFAPRLRNEDHVVSSEDKKEWTLVSKNNSQKLRNRPVRQRSTVRPEATFRQGATVITIHSK